MTTREIRSPVRAATPWLLATLVLMAPAPGRAWGPAMHAYIDHEAREEAARQGVRWGGLDREAYLAAAPAPDIWYAAEEARVVVPAGIEEDWEYVRLLFAESRDLVELSWTLGYAGHIQGDVQGHKIYLSPGGDASHLIRDAAAGFVLFGAFEGYPHYKVPIETVIGRGLDVQRGEGAAPGRWRWGGFDEAKLALMLRAAQRWCATRGKGKSGCPVQAATLGTLRKAMLEATNAAASLLSFPGYYAASSHAARNAKLVKSYDDAEFGAGGGPPRLARAVTLSIAETRDRLFERSEIVAWIRASAASDGEITRLFEDDEAGGGCAVVGGGPTPVPVLVLCLLAVMLLRRGDRRLEHRVRRSCVSYNGRMRLSIAIVLAFLLVGCSDDGEEQQPDAGQPICTAAQAKQAVADDGLSKLLAALADQASKDVLKSMVAEQCCKACPKGSATDRPLVTDMKACVTCASNYAGGDPASHVSSCTAKVCK